MTFGENFGTATLASVLSALAADICRRIDTGEPVEEIRDDARRLVEGAMELWERMVEG